ncbi:MAG: photosystem II assembly protein Psb35 [Spirulina sp.]
MSDSAPYLSSLMILVGLGFAAATLIGSVAWYNSKRPPGWEGKEKPDIVPDIHES